MKERRSFRMDKWGARDVGLLVGVVWITVHAAAAGEFGPKYVAFFTVVADVFSVVAGVFVVWLAVVLFKKLLRTLFSARTAAAIRAWHAGQLALMWVALLAVEVVLRKMMAAGRSSALDDRWLALFLVAFLALPMIPFAVTWVWFGGRSKDRNTP